MAEWARLLRRSRVRNALSQSELASRAKVPFETIVAYERSGSLVKPDVALVDQVVRAIGVGEAESQRIRDGAIEAAQYHDLASQGRLHVFSGLRVLEDFITLRDAVAEALKFDYEAPLTLKEAFSSDDLYPLQNVVGLGVGRVGTEPLGSDRPSLRVYVVRRTVPVVRQLFDLLGAVARDRKIEVRLPNDVDVVQVGRPQAYHHEQTDYSPRIPGGVMVVNLGPPVCPGTLGTWVLDDANPPNEYMLGCWHVFAAAESPVKTTELHHPNVASPTRVATINAFLAPSFAQGVTNLADAALATPTINTEGQHFLLRLGNVTGTALPTAYGTPVHKSGAKTHVTDGRIVDFFLKFKLEYHGNRIARFIGWSIEPTGGASSFSQPGDSGALILDGENRAVAMVVGGDSLGTPPQQTWAIPFHTVIDEFFNQHSKNLKLRTYR